MKNSLLLLILFTGLVSWGQRVNIDELSVSNDSYSLNGSSYNGSVYGLYDSGQLKEEFQVKNGNIEGDKIVYHQDNSFKKDRYKDTTLITQLEGNLKTLNDELSSLEKDSSMYYSRKSSLKSEMGDKYYKYKEKYNEGKLKRGKLELYEDYLFNTKKLEEKTLDVGEKRIERNKVEQKLNTEKDKSKYSHKKKDVYQYSNGLCSLHKEYDKYEKLLLEEELKDGVKNGSYKRYENGEIEEEGIYINNNKDGTWTLYYDGWKEEITYSNDIKDGDYKKYYRDVIITSGTYSYDQKQGDWKEFDNSGNITLESAYLNDTLNGPYKKYKGDVIIEEGLYTSGLMNGGWVYRYDKGKKKGEGKYVNGDGENKGSTGIPKNGRDGDWVMFFENRRKSQVGSYMNGLPDGKWSFYHEWSKPKESKQHEGTYVNGLPEGEWKEYDRSGKLISATTYRKGKVNGPYKKYFGGVVIAQGNYSINGLMNGQWSFRHTNGKSKGKGEYVNGDAGNKGIDGVPKNGRIGNWKTIGEREEERKANVIYAKKLKEEEQRRESARNTSSSYNGGNDKVLAKGRCNKDPYYKDGRVHDTDISLECGSCGRGLYGNCCRVGDPRAKQQEKEFECRRCGATNIVKYSILRTLRRGDRF